LNAKCAQTVEVTDKLELGTYPWVRRTGGILRWRDRWRLFGQATLYGMATLPWELRRALGIRRRRIASIEPTTLLPPDSRIAREAQEQLAESAGPMVINHSHRTFAFGAAIAAHDGIDFDREVVYVASLLHDLYWERPQEPPHPHCFTLPAAESALALASANGWAEERRRAVADAIALHLNVWPPRDSNESNVVFVGARLDVVGYRHWDLDPATADRILRRHPRLDLKRESARGFELQAAANPGSRVHFQTRYLASKWFTRRAPFDE
jgi:HD domain